MDRSSGRMPLLAEGSRTAWIVLGIVELIAGVLALMMPVVAALATSIMLGVLIGIEGIARLVHAFQVKRSSALIADIVLGVLAIVAAVLVVLRPMVGLLSLVLIVGLWCLFTGSVEVALSLRQPRVPGWGWLLGAGLAGIVLGVMLLLGLPGPGIWAVGLLVGLHLVFTGLSSIMTGMQFPPVGLHEPPTAPA